MSASPPREEILFTDGIVHTLDPRLPRAEAMAVCDGRIVTAGEPAEARAALGSDARVVSLGGRHVTPGFIDSHVHLEFWARARARLSLAGAGTLETVLERVRARHAALPAGAWLVGEDLLPYSAWTPAPERAALDAAAPGRAIVLWTRDRHAGFASSAAFARAGVEDRAADPAAGALGRRADGTLDGWLFEAARELVARAPGASADVAPLAPVLADLARWGVTCVHDFGDRAGWQRLVAARAEGALTARVAFGFFAPPEADRDGMAGLADDLRAARAESDAMLWPLGIKAFADGSLGAHTAHLLAPYEDGAGAGLPTLTAGHFDALSAAARELGVTLAVHAIGDAAARACLDGFARWPAAERQRLRPRIEHAQLVAREDMGRFAALGVIAAMQPIHAVDDRAMAERLWGARDAAMGYPWGQLAAAGARLAFGSDAPVASADPRLGVHATLVGGDPEAWARGHVPARALDVARAVQGFTTGAAFAMSRERELGVLAPGAWADFVTWERDPFAARAEEWPALSVLATRVGGRRVDAAPGGADV